MGFIVFYEHKATYIPMGTFKAAPTTEEIRAILSKYHPLSREYMFVEEV